MVSAIDARVEEYRREAAAARSRAESNSARRDEFLHLAENWEALAREVEHLDDAFLKGNETARI